MNTLIKQEAERRYPYISPVVDPAKKQREAFEAGASYAQSLQRPGWVSPEVARKLLAIRDELAKPDYDEAYHILYSIANPKFDSYQPWELLEKIASGDEGGSDGWISVGGYELPNIGEWVLLYNGYWTGVGKRNRIEEGDHEEKMWEDETQEYITPSPTHFMPLPSPPKQQTK
jgi:hypothetical protein